MFFWSHLIYALVVLIHGAVGAFSGAGTLEEFEALPENRKRRARTAPYIQIMLMLIFPIMNGIIRGEFEQKFVFELVTACFFSLAIFFACTIRNDDSRPILLYVAFFLYAVIKNIVVLDGFFITLVALVQAAATMVFVFMYTAFFAAGINPETAAEQKAAREKSEQYQAQRQQREAQKRYEAEQKRLQEEKDARTHEAYERIVLGKKTSRSSYSSSGSSGRSSLDDYMDNYYNRGELGTASPDVCCSNCRYFSGGVCTCDQSHSHNRVIFSPDSSSCGWHR